LDKGFNAARLGRNQTEVLRDLRCSLLPIAERLESMGHGSVSLGITLLGCALMILPAFLNAGD
jgi:hypothetical protein